MDKTSNNEAQVESTLKEIQGVINSWGPDTSLEKMREGWDSLFSGTTSAVGVSSETVLGGGVQAEWIATPKSRRDQVVVYLHGGGYVIGSIHSYRSLCERLADESCARVLAVDYRLAPEHIFPAPIEDVKSVYRWLLAEGFVSENIAFAGDSAGGGLAVAALVALRDEGLPLPACATLLSPWVDIELTGESMTSRAAIDPMLQKPLLEGLAALYIADKNVRNPLASPLYAQLNGLPPLFIQVGSCEVLYDDAVRIAEKAKNVGVEVTLDVWDGQFHVFQVFADRIDQGRQAIASLGAFIFSHIANKRNVL